MDMANAICTTTRAKCFSNSATDASLHNWNGYRTARGMAAYTSVVRDVRDRIYNMDHRR